MKVLIPQLINPNAPKIWRENAEKIYNKLTFTNKERFILEEDFSHYSGITKYGKYAAARNSIINQALKEDHTHVFWMDSDIIDFPADIIEQLYEEESNNIIAPYVLIENCEENPWKFERFYDISCFIDKNGTPFNYQPPYHNLGNGKIELLSVGTCFLIPAEIYKKGLRYNIYYSSNEHIDFFIQCQSMGYKIYATNKIVIRHAFLPKYGENFH